MSAPRLGFSYKIKVDTVPNRYISWLNEVVVEVKAKVDGADLYLVQTTDYITDIMMTRYGAPNRHLKLEWGRYSGQPLEFFVPLEDLK